jgi:hypothetical protein
MEMHIVIGAVARHDQADRRDVETGRVFRIGMPEGNTQELFPFQFDNTSLEFVRDHER